MDDDVERISDVGLDGAIGEVHAALQNATGKPREALLRGVRMDGGQRAGVPGVQELQEIEGFAAARQENYWKKKAPKWFRRSILGLREKVGGRPPEGRPPEGSPFPRPDSFQINRHPSSLKGEGRGLFLPRDLKRYRHRSYGSV